MPRTHTFTKFPGRAAVLEALRDAGTWTSHDLFTWARCNGGSEDAYAALAFYVKRGRVTYTTNRWTYAPAFSVAATQRRGG